MGLNGIKNSSIVPSFLAQLDFSIVCFQQKKLFRPTKPSILLFGTYSTGSNSSKTGRKFPPRQHGTQCLIVKTKSVLN